MTLCAIRVRESLVVIIVIFRRCYHTAVTIFCDFYPYIQRIIRIINNTFNRSCLFDLIMIFLSDICLRIVNISKRKRLAISAHRRRLDNIALACRHRRSIFSGQRECPFVARLESTSVKFLRHAQIQRSVCGICICKADGFTVICNFGIKRTFTAFRNADMDSLLALINLYVVAVFACLLNKIVILTGLIIADVIETDRTACAAAICN